MSELKHTNDIAIEILRNEYGDYDWNTWHYDREYLMLVKSQENALKQANEANKEQDKALNKHIVSGSAFIAKADRENILVLVDDKYKVFNKLREIGKTWKSITIEQIDKVV